MITGHDGAREAGMLEKPFYAFLATLAARLSFYDRPPTHVAARQVFVSFFGIQKDDDTIFPLSALPTRMPGRRATRRARDFDTLSRHLAPRKVSSPCQAARGEVASRLRRA